MSGGGDDDERRQTTTEKEREGAHTPTTTTHFYYEHAPRGGRWGARRRADVVRWRCARARSDRNTGQQREAGDEGLFGVRCDLKMMSGCVNGCLCGREECCLTKNKQSEALVVKLR